MSLKVIAKYSYPDLKVGDQDFHWCHRYAHDVVTGKIIAGKWIKKACERHLNDLNRTDVCFDEEAAKSIVLWFKFIPITDGNKKVVGKSTILLPWQIFLVCNLIAWKVTETGFRKYKYAYVQVGRKNGKSTLAGGLTLYMMYKSGYYKPRAYSVATKKDQAKELWSAAHTMITLSRRLSSIFKARTNDILMPSKQGHFIPLASESNTLDGKNPLMVNLDECHAIKDRNLYGVMVSAFGAQDEGLMLTITTAGTVLDGICTDLNKAGKQVLSLNINQDAYFYAIYEIDKEDMKTWDTEKNWIKANPGIGYQPRKLYLQERCVEASLSSEEKINFLTKHLNLFVSGYDKWLDIEEVQACRFDGTYEDYYKKECFCAIDRATTWDLTTLCLLFPNNLFAKIGDSTMPTGGADCFYINLLPRKTMEQATDHLKQIYRKAVESGSLILVDTPTVRDSQVIEIIKWAFENFNVKMLGYDPWHMKEIGNDLEEEGLPVVQVSQGTGNMSEPSKKLEGLIKETTFRYNDTLLEFAATCAMAKMTDQNNMKIVKESDKTDKIDPLISTIIALSCATLQEPVDENPYEDRDLVCV